MLNHTYLGILTPPIPIMISGKNEGFAWDSLLKNLKKIRVVTVIRSPFGGSTPNTETRHPCPMVAFQVLKGGVCQKNSGRHKGLGFL